MVGMTTDGRRGGVQLRQTAEVMRASKFGEGHAANREMHEELNAAVEEQQYPQAFDEATAMASYRIFAELTRSGAILSAHDVGEGGLGVALAEMGFSGTAGIRVDLRAAPVEMWLPPGVHLFAETPGRILFEIAPGKAHLAEAAGFAVIGETTDDGHLTVTDGDATLIQASIAALKPLWKDGLTHYY
jgi:phosphoribosylformylglycinamidine synthase